MESRNVRNVISTSEHIDLGFLWKSWDFHFTWESHVINYLEIWRALTPKYIPKSMRRSVSGDATPRRTCKKDLAASRTAILSEGALKGLSMKWETSCSLLRAKEKTIARNRRRGEADIFCLLSETICGFVVDCRRALLSLLSLLSLLFLFYRGAGGRGGSREQPVSDELARIRKPCANSYLLCRLHTPTVP